MKKKKECPFCGEEIAASAKKCRFCGERLADAGEAASVEEDADEEDPDDEDYFGIDDPQERAKLEKEERKFRRTLFSRIADLIARHSGETYWYQIFEKYEVWILLVIILIVNAAMLFLVASVGWLFDICSPWHGIIAAAASTVYGGVLAGLPLIKQQGKSVAESGEFSMVLDSLIAYVIQLLFLLSPLLFSFFMDFSRPILLLSFLLYIGYIRFFIWTGREIAAYKTWIYNVGCGNYDFLHSNRFRYWNSLAEQDADLVNMRYLRGYRFIPLRCMMMIPAASLFFSTLMMTARPDVVRGISTDITEQLQSSDKAERAEAKPADAAKEVCTFYECYLKSLDRGGDDGEVAALKKQYLTDRLRCELASKSLLGWRSVPADAGLDRGCGGEAESREGPLHERCLSGLFVGRMGKVV